MLVPAVEQVLSTLSQQVFQHHHIGYRISHPPPELCVLLIKLPKGVGDSTRPTQNLWPSHSKKAQGLLPCFQQTSGTVSPASYRLIIPTIYAEVKQFLSIRLRLQVGRLYITTSELPGNWSKTMPLFRIT